MSRRGDIKQLAEQIKRRPARTASAPRYISTGATVLNLGCSDRARGGFVLGSLVNIIGDSHAGKTLLVLTMLAECSRREALSGYELVYDEPEASFEFDIKEMFGVELEKRLKKEQSHTLLNFHGSVLDRIKEGKPFVYILDSLDSLTTDAELAKAEEQIEAARKGKDAKGSYGASKAKGMSEFFRMIVRGVEKTNSLLIIISQTRQNINPMSMAPKTRSGGDALRFYSTHEIWLAVREKLKSRGYVVGSIVRAKITKNKLTGKMRDIMFPVLSGYGVDDIGGCIDYLITQKVWKERGNDIIPTSPLEQLKGTRASIIKAVEADPKLLKELLAETEKTWTGIEDSLKPNRKPRFG